MKFILATGASGGHLFPAIAVAEELISRGHDVLIVGALSSQAGQLRQRGLEFEDIPTLGFSRGRYAKAAVMMVKAMARAFNVLGSRKPDLVIGFGGHGSFAVVQSAAVRGVPIMLHEQNVRPGRANRWLSRFAKRIAVSFDGFGHYFNPLKTTVTGCPTHLRPPQSPRQDILKRWQFSPSKATLLVFGGSQGARRINETFLKACALLKDHFEFQVIHGCGEQDLEICSQEYARLKVDARVFPFLERMDEFYTLGDVVIARSGAATVRELALFRKKAVLIPYPYAGAHQRDNAKAIEEKGYCEIIEEGELTGEGLAERIRRLLYAPVKPAADIKSVEAAAQEPAKRLADLALSLVKR
jgi:UDP-N-acetylglucosamine--N-acetylmuramyl-(pentapeptide) pyrophosphoryl-undecaprenol N-acetylglucosamine transferase